MTREEYAKTRIRNLRRRIEFCEAKIQTDEIKHRLKLDKNTLKRWLIKFPHQPKEVA